MKKRILSLLLVGCMVMSVVACGKQEEEAKPSSDEVKVEMATKVLRGTVIAVNDDYTEITVIEDLEEMVTPEESVEAPVETEENVLVEKETEVQPMNTGDMSEESEAEAEVEEKVDEVEENSDAMTVLEETDDVITDEAAEDVLLISENPSEEVDNSIPVYFVKVDSALVLNADGQEVTKESLLTDVVVEVEYEVELDKVNEEIREISAKKVKVLGERMAVYYVTNAVFDEESGMYKGESTGAYVGEVLFALDDVFSELNFTEEDTLKITSKGAMTMSFPPQIFDFKSVEILE